MSTERSVVKAGRLGEEYFQINHPSGLTLLLCPMQGFSSAYALFGTKYGSIDTCFKTGSDRDFVKVPEGIAHFLEHKLFESEDGDAFARYAKTGANANAYTSFDCTAYLFSCTDRFQESLDILLDFVCKPYFTQQTVEKEQGIIGQEIRMYDDNPQWRVFFNLLGALYQKHPVYIDIAGTVDSIAKIDADLLYQCYRTFYNLNNMVLSIAGNFSVDQVVASADRLLKKADPVEILRGEVEEPREIRTGLVEQNLPVAQPLFHIGFKGVSAGERENFLGQVLDELLIQCIAGESTPLYRRLYDAGLINAVFGGEAMAGRDYAMAMFTGESRDPMKVQEEILAEVAKLRKNGLDAAVFERCKKAAYGQHVAMYGSVNAVATQMMNAHFYGTRMYDVLETVANATLDQLNERLRTSFDPQYCAISIVSAPGAEG